MAISTILPLLNEEERAIIIKEIKRYQEIHADLLLHMVMEGWQIEQLITGRGEDSDSWVDAMGSIQTPVENFILIGIRIGVQVVFDALRSELRPFPASWEDPIFNGVLHTCAGDDECEPLEWIKDIIFPLVKEVVLS